MSNTHRLEKLRLAAAPDGTVVWFKEHNKQWFFSDKVSWASDILYVVADGFYIEERKAFAEGRKIEDRDLKDSRSIWQDDSNPIWNAEFEYRVKSKKWYELESNIGKIILVHDIDARESAQIYRKLTGYSNKSFYTSVGDVWTYAWLINPDELAKEAENV